MARRPVVVQELVERVLAGDPRAVARAITVVEDMAAPRRGSWSPSCIRTPGVRR